MSREDIDRAVRDAQRYAAEDAKLKAEATARVFDLLLGENAQGRKEHIAQNGYKYLDLADIS